MILLRLLEVLLFGLGFVFVITQVIMPLTKDRPLFPLFKKRAKLETELAETLQAKDDDALKQKIEELKKPAESADQAQK